MAIGINAAQTGKLYQKKKKNQKHLDRDLSMVMCFNSDKKSRYAKYLFWSTKKLVAVLATSTLMTKARMEDILQPLEKVLYIHYLLCFLKNLYKISTLIDLGNEVNIMTFAYAAKLGLKVRKNDIRVKKIDGSTLNTFEMVLANF